MTFFLQHIADDLLSRYGHDLSHVAVVFPNKRAGLFLSRYLAQRSSGNPVWAPRYMTISELFRTLSDKTIADPIETVCRIYRRYKKLSEAAGAEGGKTPSLDFFYGWGERLLADFDDLDKQLADARTLFRDLKDYRDLDADSPLDEEQRKQLEAFSADFAGDRLSHIRSNFRQIWQLMFPLYDGLRRELSAEGKAYEGQLFREVAEGLEAGTITISPSVKMVAFAGFNVIDRAEHTLFKALEREGRALFYWDYDTYYARPEGSAHNEAGLFMEQNLRDFPSALGGKGTDCFMQDRESRVIEYAEATTELAAAQSVASWLSDPARYDPSRGVRSAIVLCNEALLQPVLSALPEGLGEINVTMGYPLSHTPAFGVVTRFVDELKAHHDRQRVGAAEERDDAASWPVGQACMPVLEALRERLKTEAMRLHSLSLNDEKPLLRDLYTESFFQTFTLTTRLLTLLESGLLEVSLPTLFSLLSQLVRAKSVPFHGEPATGLQIMGVLETRLLDFDHVLMLSVGEGILPQKQSEASFVPPLIRRLYGLTTPERRTAVFAYYFYRLLAKAQSVRLTYNTSTDGMRKGEMSRFMRAILVEGDSRLHIRRLSLQAANRLIPPVVPRCEKDHGDLLKRVSERGLSPSALKAYFKCQLQFYYRYVRRLRTPQKTDGIIAANDFGTVLHKAAETVYTEILNGRNEEITPSRLADFIKLQGKAGLMRIVDRAFTAVGEERSAHGDPEIPYSVIAHRAIASYLEILLQYEGDQLKAGAPAKSFGNIAAEARSELTLMVPYGDTTVPFKLYGFIDRTDEATLADGTRCLRIIDYKTGRFNDNRDKVKTLDALFEDSRDYPENQLQILIYSLMHAERGMPVVPMLYYVPSMKTGDFSPNILIDKHPVTDFRELAVPFRERLVSGLAQLIAPDVPFAPTLVADHCKHCDYRLLCGR